MKRLLILAAIMAIAAFAAACGGSDSGSEGTAAVTEATDAAQAAGVVVDPPVEASMRLEWVKQGQFAGMIVADAMGWYKDAGVNLTLEPAGPSLFPAQQVAVGNDQFGVPTPLATLGAVDSGAPLVTVMQYHQDSPTAYVAKKASGIEKLEDAKGKRVGVWFGGNEFEMISMLNSIGLKKDDVKLISQGFTVVPFLKDKYDVSQVTTFNELGLILDEIPAEELNIIYPRDYGTAVIGDGVITTQEYMDQNPQVVQAVVEQTIRGWKWAIENPEKAAQMMVDANSDLDLPHQIYMMKENARLVCQGPTLDAEKGIGWVDPAAFETAAKVLFDSGQIKQMPDISKVTTNKFVEATPIEWRTVDCSAYTNG